MVAAFERCVDLIAQQQKGHERGPVFWLGEQLRDICRMTPGAAELVANDLERKGMGLVDCEKKLAELAQKNRGQIGAEDADGVIREFYGLAAFCEDAAPAAKPAGAGMRLADFL